MDLQYEESYIGAVILEPSTLDSHFVPSCMFSDVINQKIMERIEHLHEKGDPVDIVTVTDRNIELSKRARYCVEITPTAANAGYYAGKIRESGLKRKLLQLSHSLSGMLYDCSGEEALNFLESEISSMDSNSSGPMHIKQAMVEAFDDFEEASLNPGKVRGLKCGLDGLDKLTGGLQGGKLYIIGARPGMGKSALLLRFGESVSVRNKKSSLIYSIEMPAFEWAQRALCSIGRVDGGAARIGRLTGADFQNLQSTAQKLMDSNLYIDDSPTMSIQKLKQVARVHARKYGLDMIGVDYLQLLSGKGDTRQQEIGSISRGLKELAKELNVPVVALSQLNRTLEQRTDKRPNMSDLREAGDIEQDADVIMFVYRGFVYGEAGKSESDAEIIVAKQRGGPTGMIPAEWKPRFTRFDGEAV